MDWPTQLMIAQQVKQEIDNVDLDGLWENTSPNIRSSEGPIQALEARLGFSLDPQYRTFLLHADGWRSFWHHVDIFGVEDLSGSSRSHRAADLTDTLEPLAELCGYQQSELFPIAMASNNIDLFLMTRPSTLEPGKVFWFAGGLIETFEGFDEFFILMIDYLREEYQSLCEDHAIG